MRTVHVTLQGKGGVGKSYAASLLAQYHLENGRPVVCVDTDPVNDTLAGYKSFQARRVDLMDGARLDARRFDAMMEQLLGEDADFVVDNGAASFIPLSAYLVENDAVAMIAAAGKRVVIHTVVTGGQALRDTMSGFAQLARQMPAEAGMVVWLIEFFGAIQVDGKGFEEMKAYTQHKGRVGGLVRLAHQSGDTFGKDVELMLDRKLTFAEAIDSPDFGLMARRRLTMVRRAIFQQLALVV